MAISLIFLSLLVVIGVFVIFLASKQKIIIKTGKYPEGHFMGKGIAFGLPLGYLIGFLIAVLSKNNSLWFIIGSVLGMSFGLIIGLFLERKNKKRIRSLTEKERKIRRLTMLTLSALILIGILSLVIALIISN